MEGFVGGDRQLKQHTWTADTGGQVALQTRTQFFTGEVHSGVECGQSTGATYPCLMLSHTRL